MPAAQECEAGQYRRRTSSAFGEVHSFKIAEDAEPYLRLPKSHSFKIDEDVDAQRPVGWRYAQNKQSRYASLLRVAGLEEASSTSVGLNQGVTVIGADAVIPSTVTIAVVDPTFLPKKIPPGRTSTTEVSAAVHA